jgi:hypothetical protein
MRLGLYAAPLPGVFFFCLFVEKTENLVSHQKMTPGKNPKPFIEQDRVIFNKWETFKNRDIWRPVYIFSGQWNE